MSDRPSVSALRECLATVAAAHPSEASEEIATGVHRCVIAAVDDFKSLGWPPERCVIVVKEVARDAGLRFSLGLIAERHLIQQTVIAESLVPWCIEQYFANERSPS